MRNKVKLPKHIINELCDLPESGMGYQKVTLTMKNGHKLINRKVVNSEFLILDNQENYATNDFISVVLEKVSPVANNLYN